MLFAFLCDASAVFAVPGWLVLYGAALVLRFRRRTVAGRGRQLWGTVAITVLTALLLAAAASLITGILSGLAGLEALLVPLQYYSAIAVAQFQSLAQISWSSVLEQSFANPLLWWGGLFALCAALAVGCARHDGRPLFLLDVYKRQGSGAFVNTGRGDDLQPAGSGRRGRYPDSRGT